MCAPDLLDVLGNSNNPARAIPQFPKFFDAIDRYDLECPDGPDKRPVATGTHSCVGVKYAPPSPSSCRCRAMSSATWSAASRPSATRWSTLCRWTWSSTAA